VSRLTLLVPIALSAVACRGCSGSSDRESEPRATRSAIAFLRGDPGDLVVVDPDGSNERVLVKGSRGPDLAGLDRLFSWSPNGRQLLYSVKAPVDTGDVDDYDVDVYIVNADGSDRRKLRRANIWTDPVWSPRGDAVLIGDDHLGVRQLAVVNADGSGARTIPVSEEIVNVHLSPDGTKIAYDTADGVYVGNADGSAPKPLTDGGVAGWTPADHCPIPRGGLAHQPRRQRATASRPIRRANRKRRPGAGRAHDRAREGNRWFRLRARARRRRRRPIEEADRQRDGRRLAVVVAQRKGARIRATTER
jgi:WD40-like Beta Propeller Repeat